MYAALKMNEFLAHTKKKEIHIIPPKISFLNMLLEIEKKQKNP